jgi:hypothetical protein
MWDKKIKLFNVWLILDDGEKIETSGMGHNQKEIKIGFIGKSYFSNNKIVKCIDVEFK